MQIISTFLAVSSAQVLDLGIPDLGDFDLSAFGLGDLGGSESLVFPGADDEERYFFTTTTSTTTTTTTTTTITVPPGTTCWKCDQMSYAGCASNGDFETCHMGDDDCCFLEVRETKQKLSQLCTGCKEQAACDSMKSNNFNGPDQRFHQCRPDYRQQRIGQRGPNQSVCRQCFKTCDPAVDPGHCFGGPLVDGTMTTFKVALSTNQVNYPWKPHYQGADLDALGIPTRGAVDSGVDSVVIGEISAFSCVSAATCTDNLYFDNPTDGKADVSNGDNTRDIATEMVMWALQGASATWWSNDLMAIQHTLENWNVAIAHSIAGFNA